MPRPPMASANGRTFGDSATTPGFITNSTIGIPATISTTVRENSVNRRQPQSKPSFAWHLAYAAVIIFLLGGIVLLVGEYTFFRSSRFFGKETTPQSNVSTLGMEKAQQSVPAADGDPNDGHQPPVPAPGGKAGVAVSAAEKPSTNDRSEGLALAQEEHSMPDPGDGPAGIVESRSFFTDKVSVPFTINSNKIDEESYHLLDQIAQDMAKHPEMTIRVKGYTDDSGSPGYNESVSGFRASAVQSYLIGKGIDPKKIIVFAMGNANPIASNRTSAGRKRNRRVEIEFYTDQQSEQ
jgi:outer membrane protein OmpA-like peptidoglycan-associated protein